LGFEHAALAHAFLRHPLQNAFFPSAVAFAAGALQSLQIGFPGLA